VATLPGTYNLRISQGATWLQSFRWLDSLNVPINLAGYVARLQVRKSYNSPDPVISLASGGQGLVLEASGQLGRIDAELSATQTTLLEAPWAGVWDLELELAGVVTRLLQGRARVSPEVTK